VHFLRNASDDVPRRVGDDCLPELRRLRDRRDPGEAPRDLAAWLVRWQAKRPELTGRVNEKIEPRTDVVRFFPNPGCRLRLGRAWVLEPHENWLEQHRCLNVEDLREHRKEQLRPAA
jgi:transposase-like protein